VCFISFLLGAGVEEKISEIATLLLVCIMREREREERKVNKKLLGLLAKFD